MEAAGLARFKKNKHANGTAATYMHLLKWKLRDFLTKAVSKTKAAAPNTPNATPPKGVK